MQKVFKWIAAIMICFAVLTILPWTANETQAATNYSTIRVKMSIGTVSSHSFTINGTYVVGENTSIQLSAGTYTVKNANSKITLYNSSNKALYSGSTVTIKKTVNSDNVYIRMKCKSSTYNYLGDMKYTRNGSNLNAINYIYLEEYLYGVVPHEMSNSWPIEGAGDTGQDVRSKPNEPIFQL